MLRRWRERKRLRVVRERAVTDLIVTTVRLSRRIELTAASFGTDRLFDERLRRIEGDALTLRKRAEALTTATSGRVPDAVCPDCKKPVSTHGAYKDGRCPVVRFVPETPVDPLVGGQA